MALLKWNSNYSGKLGTIMKLGNRRFTITTIMKLGNRRFTITTNHNQSQPITTNHNQSQFIMGFYSKAQILNLNHRNSNFM